MSNHRQSPDWRHSPPTNADVLSESTDLDSLLTAILGEKTDSVSTVRPAPDALAAAEGVSQAAVYDATAQPPAMELPAVPRDSLAAFQSESQLKDSSSSKGFVSEEGGQSPIANLETLRDRLLHSRNAVLPLQRSKAVPKRTADRRVRTADPGSDRRAGPNVMLVDQQVTKPSIRRPQPKSHPAKSRRLSTAHFTRFSLPRVMPRPPNMADGSR